MRPLIEVMSEAMCDLGDWNPQESAEYVAGRLRAAGFRILGPDEVADVQRIVEIANRNEWSAEGDRLVRALGRKA